MYPPGRAPKTLFSVEFSSYMIYCMEVELTLSNDDFTEY